MPDAAIGRHVDGQCALLPVPGAGIGVVLGLFVGSFVAGNTTFRLFDPVAILAVIAVIYTGLACSITPFVRTMAERNVALRE